MDRPQASDGCSLPSRRLGYAGSVERTEDTERAVRARKTHAFARDI